MQESTGELKCYQYITIASTGNATDFGDLTQNKENTSTTPMKLQEYFWWKFQAKGQCYRKFYIASLVTLVTFRFKCSADRQAACSCYTMQSVKESDGVSNTLEYVTMHPQEL